MREPTIHQDVRCGGSGCQRTIQHGRNDLRSCSERFLSTLVAVRSFIDVFADPIDGRYEQRKEQGIAAVQLQRSIEGGSANAGESVPPA